MFRVFAQHEIQLDKTKLHVSPLVKGIKVPWELIWGLDSTLWVTHYPGKVSSVNPQTGELHNLLTISDIVSGGEIQARMVGLATTSPDSPLDYAFVNYVYNGDPYTALEWNKYMKIVRYDYDRQERVLKSPQVLLDRIKVYDGWHVAGKLLIGADEKLYAAIGDAKQPESPENHPDWDGVSPITVDLDRYSGKILRMELDGSVPHDNPFAEAPYDKTPRNLIWSYGHRNTQGLVLGQNGQMFYAEHGPANDDEIGNVLKGGDYGWPMVEGYCNTDQEKDYCLMHPNFVKPLKSWTPTIAPSNMEYYHHELIPEWKNSLLVATLTAGGRGEDIRVLGLTEGGNDVTSEEIILDGLFGRIRDLCVAPDGLIYFTTSNRILSSTFLGNDDWIVKISPANQDKTLGFDEIKNSELFAPTIMFKGCMLSIDHPVYAGPFELVIMDFFGKRLHAQTYYNDLISIPVSGKGQIIVSIRYSSGRNHHYKLVSLQ